MRVRRQKMPQDPALYLELTGGGSGWFEFGLEEHEQETQNITSHQLKICKLPFAHGAFRNSPRACPFESDVKTLSSRPQT
jgi:hypothetical protein